MTGFDYAVSPGDFIREWMDEHGVGVSEMARRLSVSDEIVTGLLSGDEPVTPQLAARLEHVTETPARLWERTEAIYREDSQVSS